MSPNLTDLRVLIVAEDPLVRAGLAALLGDQRGIIVAGQSAPDSDLAAEFRAYRPDVLVWDLGAASVPALQLLGEARDAGAPIVALVPDGGHAPAARAAGARGLLPRGTDAATLAAGLRAVAQGLVVLAPEMAAASEHTDQSPSSDTAGLTPRELEVLRLVAEGLPNKAISQRLGISEHTVKFHVNAVLGKLDAQSRTEAVIIATRRGLILL